MKDMIKGTTFPSDAGDEFIAETLKRWPDTKAILVVKQDAEGHVKIDTYSGIATPTVVEMVAEWAYQMAIELGMPE